MTVFYVYVLLDQTKPGNYKYGRWTFKYEPFYVGKGKDTRCFHHFVCLSNKQRRSPKEKRIHYIHRRTGEEPKVVIKKRNLTEVDAFNYERILIATIGREDRKEGPLLNRCAGGDGNAGRKDRPEVVERRAASIRAKLKEDPSIIARRNLKSRQTRANWSRRKQERFIEKCKTSNRSSDPRVRKKMSQSGKLRVQTESQEAKAKRSKSLTEAQKRVWASLTPEERLRRTTASSKFHYEMTDKRRKEYIAKVSQSVKQIHATRPPEVAKGIYTKISQTLKSKPPEHKQRIACGNAMRGLLQRYSIDLHHPVIRPKLDVLIRNFPFDGRPETKDNFLLKVDRLVQRHR